MATPIKSSNINGTTTNGAAASPSLNDLMSRLNGQASGSDSQNQQLAFSRWMEKHAIVADGQNPAPKSPDTSSTQPSSTMTGTWWELSRSRTSCVITVARCRPICDAFPNSAERPV